MSCGVIGVFRPLRLRTLLRSILPVRLGGEILSLSAEEMVPYKIIS